MSKATCIYMTLKKELIVISSFKVLRYSHYKQTQKSIISSNVKKYFFLKNNKAAPIFFSKEYANYKFI